MKFLIFFLVPLFSLAGVQQFKSAQIKEHTKGAKVRFLTAPSVHGNKNAFIGHLTVPARGQVPLHQDMTEEYLYILEGSGTLWINGKAFQIKEKDTVYMEAGAKVRFKMETNL